MTENLALLSYGDIFFLFVSGAALGVIYHGLLWLSVAYMRFFKNPKTFLLLSSVARLTLLIFMALWLAHDSATRFILLFLGFLAARTFCVGLVRKSIKKHVQQKPE